MLTMILLASQIYASEQPRVFSGDYIEGVYGRFFEFTEKRRSAPCPVIIDHFHRGGPSALGNSWIVPHDKISHQGVQCDDGGAMTLNQFDSRSHLPDDLLANEIAEKTFVLMKNDSTGFWMGADARTCGKWTFPNPTFIFFVREFDRHIKSFFNIDLAAGKKYMFVVAESFICIYKDVPRQTPAPDVVINSSGDLEGSSQGTSDPKPETSALPTAFGGDSFDDSEFENDPSDSKYPTPSLVPAPTPSGDTNGSGNPGITVTIPVPGSDNSETIVSPPENGDESVEEVDKEPPNNEELSIIDIAEGAQPPISSPDEDNISILDIAKEEDFENGSAGGSSSGQDNPTGETGESEGNGDGNSSDNSSTPGGLDAQAEDSLCFAGDCTVELRDGRVVRMDELAVGDEVRVGMDAFSAVFMFTHKMKGRISSFVELGTKCGKRIRLTSGHLLYVNNRIVPAREVRKDDMLLTASGTNSKVVKINKVWRRGVYNPQTIQGDIVVNEIVASTYTTTIVAGAAHGILTPLRALWNGVGVNVIGCLLESHSLQSELVSGIPRTRSKAEL